MFSLPSAVLLSAALALASAGVVHPPARFTDSGPATASSTATATGGATATPPHRSATSSVDSRRATPPRHSATPSVDPHRSATPSVAEPRAGLRDAEARTVRSPVTVRRTAWTMGTSLSIEVSGPDARALSERMLREVEAAEAMLSSWDPDSELSRAASAAAGMRVELSPELDALLTEVGFWSERTGRAFDPNVGALIDAWGLRAEPAIPEPDALAHARSAVRSGTFSRGADGWRRTESPTWIDAGAFGKGWALRRAAARLLSSEGVGATLDFGGQIVRVGSSHGPEWVPIAHPAHRDVAVLLVRLPVGDLRSVATSGNGVRGEVVDGVRVGHLLDPRTGEPAPFEGSVSVLATDPMEADLLATALFVLGPEAGSDLVRTLPGVDALWLDPAGDVLHTTLDPEAVRLRSIPGAGFADSGTPVTTPASAGAHR